MNTDSVRNIAFHDIGKYISENRNEYKFSEPWERFEAWNVTPNHLDSKESTRFNRKLNVDLANHSSERKIKHLENLWEKSRKKTT